jgi:FAD/FMN-containing dehydrogenase
MARRSPPSAEDTTLGVLSRLPAIRGETLLDDLSLTPYRSASGPVSISPVACVRPLDQDDLSALLSWATREKVSVIPRGAGTGMPGGNVGPGVTLDLSASFTDIGLPRKEDGTIKVGAGVVAADVEQAARSVGLFLPPLPSSAKRCTVGGMVANNAAGARTYKYGAIRDWVRELEVVLHDGSQHRLIRGSRGPEVFEAVHQSLREEMGSVPSSWPTVRKNSSGYALDRFMPQGDPVELVVGSEGTLAVVASVTLDLAPVPEATALALVAVHGADDIASVLEAAAALDASACEFFGRRFLEITSMSSHPMVGPTVADAEAAFLIEVDGPIDEVADGLEALRRLGHELGSPAITAAESADREVLWEIRHAASPLVAACADRGLLSTQIIEDSVVPTENLGRYVTELNGILAKWETDAVIFGHAGDANVHVNPLLDVSRAGWPDTARGILEDTTDLVAGLGGTLAGEHGDGRIRAPLLERIWGDSLTRAFFGVKDQVDPAGILNPGVILPLPGQDPLEGLWPQYGGLA